MPLVVSFLDPEFALNFAFSRAYTVVLSENNGIFFPFTFGFASGILILAMILDLKEPVSVKTVYNSKKNRVYPSELLWRNDSYKITKIGLHHVYKQGSKLFHVFSVDTPILSFKLQLDTDSLFWTVEQISDGLPD